MSNTAQIRIIASMHDESVSPSIIHEVSENEMYVGYCLPDCKSTSEAKWMVKQITRETVAGATGTYQYIKYMNGSKRFDQVWNNHVSSSAKYYFVNENF